MWPRGPVAIPKSVTLTMFGCRSVPHACASRWNRARKCAFAAHFGRDRLHRDHARGSEVRREVDVAHAACT